MVTKNRNPNTDVFESLPSADTEAERAVIGSILLLPEVLDDLAATLTPEDFQTPQYATLYRHMQGLCNSGKRVDQKLLVESLRRANQLGDGKHATHPAVTDLIECAQSVFSAANAQHYGRIVRDRAVRRAIHFAGTEILQCASIDDGNEAVNRVEELAFAVRDKHRCGIERVTDSASLLQSAMRQLEDAENGKVRETFPTGFCDLDKRITLRPQMLAILAARPSMGKSALALNIATQVSEHHGVLFISLEMSSDELAMRMLAAESEVNLFSLSNDVLPPAQRQRIVSAGGKLSALKLVVDDSPTRTVTEIAAVARREKRRRGLKLLVVDYLQLVTPEDEKVPREQQVAKIAKRLKAIARELDICVLCLAQLNRQNESAADKRPTLANLRESGAIEQDADAVLFIHREEYYLMPDVAREKKVEGIAEIIVRKQRQGPIGTTKLLWQKHWTRFVSLADQPVEERDNYEPAFASYSNGF